MANIHEMLSMLGWGAVGGALPTVGKIAGTYGANFAAPAPEWTGVTIAIGLYAAVGSIMARAMDNPDMRQALFAGVAAPAILASVVAGVTDSRGVPKEQLAPMAAPARSGLLVSYAFAETRTPVPAQATSKVYLVEASVDGGVPVSGSIKIEAVMPDGEPTYAGLLSIGGPYQRTIISVPDKARSLRFVSKEGTLWSELQLTAVSTRILLKIYPRTSAGNDLLWALGSQRGFDIGGINAELEGMSSRLP